jgi:malonyl CoA-acyl carrier protein transacylase
VTVYVSCTGLAYDALEAQAIAQNLLKKKAASDLGQSYGLVGVIVAKPAVIEERDGVATLQVTVVGTWSYQLNDKQKQELASQLTNKTRAGAQEFLKAYKGITKARINVTNGDNSLPSDPGQISIVVQAASLTN